MTDSSSDTASCDSSKVPKISSWSTNARARSKWKCVLKSPFSFLWYYSADCTHLQKHWIKLNKPKAMDEMQQAICSCSKISLLNVRSVDFVVSFLGNLTFTSLDNLLTSLCTVDETVFLKCVPSLSLPNTFCSFHCTPVWNVIYMNQWFLYNSLLVFRNYHGTVLFAIVVLPNNPVLLSICVIYSTVYILYPLYRV